MSTPNPVAPQKKLDAVLAIIREIAEKSDDGNYIYRGESECHLESPYYGTVSSSLWRKYFSDVGPFNIEVVEKEMLSDAKKHIGQLPHDLDSVGVPNVAEANADETINFELLTEIQHYEGKTNLIDFTTDYLIALFFACDGNHDKDGRVILQKTEQIRDMIKSPQNPRNRVIAQKSIFVYPPTGVIEPHENDIVIIPAHLKKWMLEHLRTCHGISTETIYNDLHGFIRNQGIHGGAYTRFYKGLACHNRGDRAETVEERQQEYEESIRYYGEAIKLKPDFVIAYYNLGAVYSRNNDFDSAIEHFNMAIQLDPNYASAYASRGLTYNIKGEYDNAISDFNMAVLLDPNLAGVYNNRGFVYNNKGMYDEAILDFNTAIELNSKNASLYNARGFAYNRKGEYEWALPDFHTAMQLNPKFARAYFNRGITWLHLENWEYARLDLTTAKNMGVDIINAFQRYYPSITDFTQATRIQLPPDIVAMLTPPQA